MQLRTLGRTGLAVSRIGLGMAALGRPGYINIGHAADLGAQYDPAVMQARAHTVLDAAYAAGVRHFDVARSYGRGEEFLGAWLRERRVGAGECTVASKWGYAYTAGWRVEAPVHEVKEHALDRFAQQLAESRALLGDRLSLYQVHSATLESGALGDAALHAAMVRLREAGVHVGITLTGPGQARTLAAAMAVHADGLRLFETVQATWNVLERAAEPVLAEAHASGMGVIVKEALANGRLTERNSDPAFAPQLARMRAHARRLGTSVDALALAAALRNPWADVVLSGAATVAHVQSNVSACDVAFDAAAATDLARLAEPAEEYWALRSRLPWN